MFAYTFLNVKRGCTANSVFFCLTPNLRRSVYIFTHNHLLLKKKQFELHLNGLNVDVYERVDITPCTLALEKEKLFLCSVEKNAVLSMKWKNSATCAAVVVIEVEKFIKYVPKLCAVFLEMNFLWVICHFGIVSTCTKVFFATESFAVKRVYRLKL